MTDECSHREVETIEHHAYQQVLIRKHRCTSCGKSLVAYVDFDPRDYETRE